MTVVGKTAFHKAIPNLLGHVNSWSVLGVRQGGYVCRAPFGHSDKEGKSSVVEDMGLLAGVPPWSRVSWGLCSLSFKQPLSRTVLMTVAEERNGGGYFVWPKQYFFS